MSVRDARDTLTRAVESILNQSCADFEFLIVDDGSSDGSEEILAGLAQKDSRVRILTQENQGLTRALVRGCLEARGVWIARQDADDWSEPQRLAKCLALAEADPDCVMVSSWVIYRGPRGELLEEIQRPEDCLTATERLLRQGEGPPAHGSVMFRKDIYELSGGYRPEFYFGQDSDLWMRMAGYGKICYAQEVLYQYTLSAQAISGRFGTIQRRFGELGQSCNSARLQGGSEKPFLAEAVRLSNELWSGCPKEFRGEAAAANYRIGVRLARRRDPAAKRYFREALRLEPLHWRVWIRLVLSLFQR